MLECGPKLVANPEHLKLLQQGVDVWNAWRTREPSARPDLRKADLSGADLNGADLNKANVNGAFLVETKLAGAKLRQADLRRANLREADLRGADLMGARLSQANLGKAQLQTANLFGANLVNAGLIRADLMAADLIEANFGGANLSSANLGPALLDGANFSGARLYRANLHGASLRGTDLRGADLRGAVLVETNLVDAVLTGCRVYGVSSWNVKLSEGTKQQDLIITDEDEPEVTVDNIEVAQFVYLLLHNEKIRDILDTVGKKGVLLLGRFTEGRIVVLDRLRDQLRKRGYLPIVFNFDKPETKDFTETVRLLAGLSKFVIADITNPKSAPLELQATVPEIMVPFRPIIEEGEEPFAMLQDLWSKHREWVFEPIYYSSVDNLIAALDEKIIRPAEARFIELQKRKADPMGGEHV
jgi:uncharacterized protein YjbI with pentapeptide repeats